MIENKFFIIVLSQKRAFTSILLLFQLVSISWEQVLNVTTGNNDAVPGAEDKAGDNLQFGTLHTLHNISRWAKHEENLSLALQERLEFLQKERKLIRTYLDDYEESTGKAMENLYEPRNTSQERGEVVGSSGVLSHRMITRYTNVLDIMKELFDSEAYIGNLDKLQELLISDLVEYCCHNETVATLHEDLYSDKEENEGLLKLPVLKPNWRDKYMSSLSLIHIQNAYGLPPSQIRNGLISSSNEGKLDAVDCLELGVFALHRQLYTASIQWLKLAKKVLSEDDSLLLDGGIISAFLAVAIQQNNYHLHETQDFDISAYDQVVVEHSSIFQEMYLSPISESMPEVERRTGRHFAYISGKAGEAHKMIIQQSQYMDICRGATLQTPLQKTRLRCFYERKCHPYLFINPVKAEQLSEEPPIFQFYEMLTKRDTQNYERLANLKMHMISTVVTNGSFEFLTSIRNSVGMTVRDDEIPGPIKLASKVTGLTVFNNSDTQLVEYTYGRYYSFHSDSLRSDDEALLEDFTIDDRLATLLYYVDMPEIGGLTPFCEAGVSAWPVPGSAVLWYNLYRNGSMRTDVTHASCPVIHGRKFIVNHRIRYNGNFLTHPCSLNQYE